MEKSLEMALSERVNEQALRQLHANNDINGLLDWALMLNAVYMTQRVAAERAARQAAKKIGDGFFSGPNFYAMARELAPSAPAE